MRYNIYIRHVVRVLWYADSFLNRRMDIMDYLWWHIPVITSPMLIAFIAVVHILVSHYAVGGGIFLAWELGYAYRKKNDPYVAYLRRHAQFFILLTVVFGAITGVGIWWTIALTSPLATEMLIRTFVFGWATEWVFFIIELVAAFLFFYGWPETGRIGSLPRKTHLLIGWIYASAAWISLVLITGITGFMLHTGNFLEHPTFWTGFLNPQFIPQTLTRTGGSLLLASLYVTLHASVCRLNPEMTKLVVGRMGRFALTGVILSILGVIMVGMNLPLTAEYTLLRAAAVNVILSVGAGAAALLVVFLITVTCRPGWLTPLGASAMFVLGLVAFTSAEFVREAIRKPYVVYDVVMSNQIYKADIAKIRHQGLLQSGYWTRLYMQEKFPYTVIPCTGEEPGSIPSTGDALETSLAPGVDVGKKESVRIGKAGSADRMDSQVNVLSEVVPKKTADFPVKNVSRNQNIRLDLTRVLPQDRVAVGKVIFMHHCNDCHAENLGYSGIAPLATSRSREEMVSFIKNLNSMVYYMPPWCGNDTEAELLVDYLRSVAFPYPVTDKGILEEKK